VKVTLGQGDEQTINALNAIELHVRQRGDGPAQLEMEGRAYTLDAAAEATQAARDYVE
jgi:hypothetical protein